MNLNPAAPTGPAILLFRGRGLVSALIRWQTRGIYSHAALLDEDGWILEAWQGEGVRMRRPLDDWSGVDGFTIPGFTAQQWREALVFAESERKCGYDYWGVIRFISRRRMPHNDRWFCSELVFEAIRHAGLRLLNRIPSDEVSPEMLSLSPLLQPIEIHAHESARVESSGLPASARGGEVTGSQAAGLRSRSWLRLLPFMKHATTVLILCALMCSCASRSNPPASTTVTTTAADGSVSTATTAPVIDPIDQAIADATRALFNH